MHKIAAYVDQRSSLAIKEQVERLLGRSYRIWSTQHGADKLVKFRAVSYARLAADTLGCGRARP